MKYLSAVLILAISMVGGQAAQAAPTGAPLHGGYFDAAYAMTDGAIVAETSFTLNGTVAAVHYSENTIDLLVGAAHDVIHVTPTTSISHKGETGSMADIRPNQKLTVTGVLRGGERIAVSIIIN